MGTETAVDLYAMLGVSKAAKDTEASCCASISTCTLLLPAIMRGLAHPTCQRRSKRHVMKRPAPAMQHASSLRRPLTDPRLQIRRAYRNLVTREHPDKGGDAERFRLIQQAYEVLSDASKVGGHGWHRRTE